MAKLGAAFGDLDKPEMRGKEGAALLTFRAAALMPAKNPA
jgi:hypothetical protein